MGHEKARRKRASKLTLQQLENDDWGDPTPDDTRLVTTVLNLRRKAIAALTVEDLRIMLGQQVGVPTLVPLALDLLEANPLTEGDLYPGDLLASVTRIPDSYWQEHPEEKIRLDGVTRDITD